jgi:hypothetical protein
MEEHLLQVMHSKNMKDTKKRDLKIGTVVRLIGSPTLHVVL